MGYVHWTAEQVEELNQILADLRRRRRHSQLPFAQPRTGPIEFRVGKADSAISSGGTGTVSLWHRVLDEDDIESWEDTGDDVEAYDWMNAGPIAAGERVHLHRHADSVGALWMIDRSAVGMWSGYLASDQTLTSTTAADVALSQLVNTNSEIFGTPASGYSVRLSRAGTYECTISLQLKPYSNTAYGVDAWMKTPGGDVAKSRLRHTWVLSSVFPSGEDEQHISRTFPIVCETADTDCKLVAAEYEGSGGFGFGDVTLIGGGSTSLGGCVVDVRFVR